MPTQLQLEWQDGKIQTFNSLNFLNDLKIEESEMYFAELYPPLLVGKNESSHVYFQNFSFSEKSVTFFAPYPYSISFPPELKILKMTLKSPGKYFRFHHFLKFLHRAYSFKK